MRRPLPLLVLALLVVSVAQAQSLRLDGTASAEAANAAGLTISGVNVFCGVVGHDLGVWSQSVMV